MRKIVRVELVDNEIRGISCDISGIDEHDAKAIRDYFAGTARWIREDNKRQARRGGN